MNNLDRQSPGAAAPEAAAPGRAAVGQDILERWVYELGLVLTTFYPAGRWRLEKEWQRRREFPK